MLHQVKACHQSDDHRIILNPYFPTGVIVEPRDPLERQAGDLEVDPVLLPYLEATDGYQILWPLCGLGILGAIPLLVRLMAVEDERGQAPVPAAPSPLP